MIQELDYNKLSSKNKDEIVDLFQTIEEGLNKIGLQEKNREI